MVGEVLDLSLRIAAAAAAVGLILVLMRVRSGAARHAAWTAVLLTMLTMPLLTAIVPRIEVPVPSHLAIDPGAVAAEVHPTGFPGGPEAEVRPTTSAVGETLPSPVRPRPAPVVASPRAFPWWKVAAGLYAFGAIALMARLASGWILAARLVRSSRRISLRAVAPVFESGAIAAPVTTGIVKASIILPTAWREWPADTLRAVLAHEEAHVRRRDLLVQFLARANQAVCWFHPLAWWLERRLAAAAEQACDEAVVQTCGGPGRYAEILLDIAEAVRGRGARVAWTAIGMDGSGLLAARIERLLHGDLSDRMPLGRRLVISGACAATLVLAVACRQQVVATPLRPDPQVERAIEANEVRSAKHRAAVSLTVAEVAALEASLDANGANLAAREQLITYYRFSESAAWEDRLSGLRRHTVWLIANAPDSGLWIPTISKTHDPAGYAEARQLWLQQTSTADASVQVLAAAADFLSAYDKALAEELLLRARDLDPGAATLRAGAQPGVAVPSWSARLGMLYARAVAGNVDHTTSRVEAAEAASPFAEEARRKLDATTDAQILRAAGTTLARYRAEPEHAVLSRGYLERAVQFDPQDVHAKAALANAQINDRRSAIEAQLRAAGARDKFDEFSETTYAAVSALPVADRLFYLPWAAEMAYMRAESVEYTARNKPEDQQADAYRKAQAGWDRARQYAEDALALAAGNTNSEDYGAVIYRANAVLGVLALKEGDRTGAVAHMQRAGEAPATEALAFSQYSSLRGRLVEYLLREGERASVAAFLEKSAFLTQPGRERLLKDAEQIRNGVMPMAYQYAEARR